MSDKPDTSMLDTAGQTVTREPIEGGVKIVNGALPAGHPDRVLWREVSAAERSEAKTRAASHAAFTRSNDTVFMRLRRDRMLRATDYMEHGDGPAPEWAKWRQQLRDLPGKTKDPGDPKWPSPPAATSALLEWRNVWPDVDWSGLLK